MQPKAHSQKVHFTEAEAAEQLGISVDELRSLIRRHIVDDEGDASNVPMTSFQASDLLVLRLLARKPA